MCLCSDQDKKLQFFLSTHDPPMMLLGGHGVMEDRSGVRRPGLAVLACHLCVLGEIPAFSEPVFHLLNGNLHLRCVVRKEGDSLTQRMVVPFSFSDLLHPLAFPILYCT